MRVKLITFFRSKAEEAAAATIVYEGQQQNNLRPTISKKNDLLFCRRGFDMLKSKVVSHPDKLENENLKKAVTNSCRSFNSLRVNTRKRK